LKIFNRLKNTRNKIINSEKGKKRRKYTMLKRLTKTNPKKIIRGYFLRREKIKGKIFNPKI